MGGASRDLRVVRGLQEGAPEVAVEGEGELEEPKPGAFRGKHRGGIKRNADCRGRLYTTNTPTPMWLAHGLRSNRPPGHFKERGGGVVGPNSRRGQQLLLCILHQRGVTTSQPGRKTISKKSKFRKTGEGVKKSGRGQRHGGWGV